MQIIIKTIIEEDFSNYKKPSMLIAFPHCDFKCEEENGLRCCQNRTLAASKNQQIECQNILNRYLNNKLTSAIVIGGLEPFDDFKQLLELIKKFRNEKCDDDFVIYTGYNKDEITNEIRLLSAYKNIIVKFGRYIPEQEKHYEEILGVYLASDNQYAERIS